MVTLKREGARAYSALDSAGSVIGRGSSSSELFGLPLPHGQRFLEIHVAPEHRRTGIGTAIFETLEQDARQDGARSLACSVAASDDAALAFATRRGFRFDYHMLDLELDVETFDPAPWAEFVPAVEQRGFSFTTLLQEQDHTSLLQKMYQLDERTSSDVPQWSGIMPPFDQYCRDMVACDPEAVIIAMWQGEPVGFAMTDGEGYTHYLAVDRPHRGKGVALALKLLTIEWARRKGLPRLSSNCNGASEAILSVNRRLGFTIRPGTIYLIK